MSATRRCYAPHGITYDGAGNLLVTEWSQCGCVACNGESSPMGHKTAAMTAAPTLLSSGGDFGAPTTVHASCLKIIDMFQIPF